jgi:adenylate kinase family enzyme
MENRIRNSKKILIIGDPGRGKTTLAETISKELSIPFYSTDDFLYEKKFSAYKEKSKSISEISEIYKKDKWIVEGTTHFLLKNGLEPADIIIYLKHDNIFSQWYSIIKRYFKREDKDILRTLWLLWHVLYKKLQTKSSRIKNGQMTTYERIEPYKNKVIILKTFKDIDELIKSVKNI